jgi:hypothetical protein
VNTELYAIYTQADGNAGCESTPSSELVEARRKLAILANVCQQLIAAIDCDLPTVPMPTHTHLRAARDAAATALKAVA